MISALQSEAASCTGRFVDLSTDGIRIKSKAEFEVGRLLRLEADNEVMVTEVHVCESHGGEFSAGLWILASLEKSELKRLGREAVGESWFECTPHNLEPAVV
jgi:hypothetical protein